MKKNIHDSIYFNRIFKPEKESGIYRIFNIQTLDSYIGSTTDLKRREYEHRHRINKRIHYSKLILDHAEEYGNDSFIFEILEMCDIDQLKIKEQIYINILNPTYNRNRSGSDYASYRYSSDRFNIQINIETIKRIRKNALKKGISSLLYLKNIIEECAERDHNE